MVDYSKWDHIEISDDEDDTHPNVDTPSLFRWRHTARIEREEKEAAENAKKNAESKIRKSKVEELQEKLAKLESSDDSSEGRKAQIKGVKDELEILSKNEDEFQRKERELKEYQEAHPNWNVDNLSKDKHNRTIINKEPKKAPKTEESEANDLSEYFKKYDKEVKQFGMLSKYEESHKFLRERMHLVCEHLGSFLVIWAVDLAVEEKHELKERVAHQAIIAQYILELARTLKRDPRSCIDAFFTRIKTAEEQYMNAFDDEYKSLLKRVDERKEARLEEARKQVEAEEAAEREARLGPGGLDPLEVIEQIPSKMKKAFQEQNTPLLKESFAELSEEEMERVYKMVVDSGLWVPQAESGQEGGGDDATDGTGN